MSNTIYYKGYSAKPEYSAEDKIFYGVLLGIDDLVNFEAENAKDVEKEFHSAVDDYLAFCKEIGKAPQESYSGSFTVRIAPELHRKISVQAQSKGISLSTALEQAIAAYN